MKSFLYVLSMFFLLTGVCFANTPPLKTSQSQQQQNLADAIEYIETDVAVTPEALVAQAGQLPWVSTTSQTPVLPHTHKAYWVRFIIDNQSDTKLDKLIGIGFPLLDAASLYQLGAGQSMKLISQQSIAALFKSAEKTSGSYVFHIELAANSQTQFYLKLTNDSKIHLPIHLYSPDTFYVTQSRSSFWLGMGLGILVIMAFAAFCLAFTKEESGFSYFACFVLCFVVYYCASTGYVIEFLWPQMIRYANQIGLLSLALCLTAMACFVRVFLSLKTHNKVMDRVIKWACGAILCIAAMAIFVEHSVQVYVQLGLFLLIYFLIQYATFLVPSSQRYGLKRFSGCLFIIGISAALFAANRLGVIERNLFNEHVLLISQFVAFIFLFNWVYEWVRREQINTQQAQQEAQTLYQDMYDIYEYAVEGHFIARPNGQFVRVNKSFCELLDCQSLAEVNEKYRKMQNLYHSPEQRDKLIRRVLREQRVYNYETQWKTVNQQLKWVSINIRAVKKDGESLIIGSVLEISKRKNAEQKLQYMASHDSLTGLTNRSAFETYLSNVLEQCQLNNTKHCLLYMDLDQFKLVNDTCGHRAGDMLLVQLSERFKSLLSASNAIARFGGDEFCILLENHTATQAMKVAQEIRHSVEAFRFLWQGRSFNLGISIGMVELHSNNCVLNEVLSFADTACYTAKELGRNRIHQYTACDQSMQARQNEMLQVSEISEALARDHFVLYCQDIASLQTQDKGFHYEILLRMRGESGRLLAPGQFLPAAERYGLMTRIDRWVIQHYFLWLSQHPEHLKQLDKCAINLSGLTLSDDKIQAFILDCFDKYNIPYHKICFEITETVAIMQLDKTLNFIQCFKALGCHFSLDDFGSGFSSYVYLKNLPVDYLKIDGCFVKDMIEDKVDMAMVKSICEVAKAIGIESIAEFVENDAIREELLNIGVGYAQGYGISRPKPLQEFLLASA